MKALLIGVALLLCLSASAFAEGYGSRSNYQSSNYVKLPYFAKDKKPASGVAPGVIISSTGLGTNDCGHTSTGNNNVFVVCVSDGTNWRAI